MALDIIGHISSEVTQLTTEQKQAMLDDLCATHQYQEEIDGEANPETKKQFANRMIIEQIKRWCNGWRKSKAIAAANYEELELS